MAEVLEDNLHAADPLPQLDTEEEIKMTIVFIALSAWIAARAALIAWAVQSANR